VGGIYALDVSKHRTKEGLLCVAAGRLMISRAVTGWVLSQASP